MLEGEHVLEAGDTCHSVQEVVDFAGQVGKPLSSHIMFGLQGPQVGGGVGSGGKLGFLGGHPPMGLGKGSHSLF